MPLPPEKRRFLVAHLGEAKVKDIEERLSALSKQLEEEGVEFKELAACTNGLCSADKGSWAESDTGLPSAPARKVRGDAVAAAIAEDLRSLGVGQKEDMAVMAAPKPFGGATSWADLAAAEELANVEAGIADLWNTFESVASNIRQSDKPTPEKVALLKSAVADFLKAVSQVKPAGAAQATAQGGKARALDPIIEDLNRLGPRRPTEAQKQAVKELSKLRDPAGAYLRDLAEKGAVQG